MVTRHLTSKELELLIDGKPEELSADIRTHAESCHQCRQEIAELAPLFHWPTHTVQASVEQLTDQVIAQVSRQKREAFFKRMLMVLAALLGLALCVSIGSVLWLYLPADIRASVTGLLPVMQWMESFTEAFATVNWLSLSTFSLLIGGLIVLSLIMLADSMLSRLVKRIKSEPREHKVISQEATQGNRT